MLRKLFNELLDNDVYSDIAFNTCLVLDGIRTAFFLQRLPYYFPASEDFQDFLFKYRQIIEPYPLKIVTFDTNNYFVLRTETSMPKVQTPFEIGKLLGFECPGQLDGQYIHLMDVKLISKKYQTFYAEICNKIHEDEFELRIEQLEDFIVEHDLPVKVRLQIRKRLQSKRRNPQYRRNISDEDLEYLKQQMELGDAEALQQLIDEGELNPNRVALAAFLGDPLALQVSEPLDPSPALGWAGLPKTMKVLRFGGLDKKLLVSCSADFAEHVLHMFEEANPNDDRPRLAIQAARDCADELITPDAYAELITTDAYAAWADAIWTDAIADTSNAANAAYTAWTLFAGLRSESPGKWIAAPPRIAHASADAAENRELEIAWQTQRLIDYLLGRIN